MNSYQNTAGDETSLDGDMPSEAEAAFWDVSTGVFTSFQPEPIQKGMLREDPPQAKVYDLSERTALFGESVVRFAKSLPFSPVNNRPIDQFVGSGTSIGANYCEADDCVSVRDFRHRISICRKESKETRYWLRMLATAEPARKDEARVLWREATELNLIFSAIWRKVGKEEIQNSKAEA